MRQPRLLVVLALALALAGALGARDAAAQCFVSGPYLGTGPKLPLGCPVHLYVGLTPTPFAPRLTVLRNGQYVDATGPINQTQASLTVMRTFDSCNGASGATTTTLESFQHYTIPPLNVQVGEEIGVGSGWFTGITITAAASCAAPIEPMPACAEIQPCFKEPPFDSFESNGCAARGGGGLPAGAALLGLGLMRWVPRRRRRR